MPVPRSIVFASAFLLCAVDFLQSGMVAFAASPIMGEIGAGPEEFSLIASLYACVAVVAIAKQQWLIERFGWRRYLACTTPVYVAGALVCANSSDVVAFGAGRIVMALGGGAFMATARIMVNLDRPGPGRFTGVKWFASGLAAGTGAAPWLASMAVIDDAWPMIFYGLIAVAASGVALALTVVPAGRPARQGASNLAPARLLLLAASAFFLLYLLQRSYYDFYSDTAVIGCFLAIAAFGLYTYVRLDHSHRAPIIRIREVSSPRYIAGLSLFALCYVLLGGNNYVIPGFLQRGLGFSWESTGLLESIGLAACLVTWLVMSWLVPRSPALGKYLATGLACLGAFGWLMSRLSPDADPYGHVLPLLVLNGCFIMLGLATAAIHTFKGLAGDDDLFAHGYQIKVIVAQLAMALGTSVATLVTQWRNTVQYDRVGTYVDPGSANYQVAASKIMATLTARAGSRHAGGLTSATIAQDLARQAVLIGDSEYFVAISVLALVGLVALVARATVSQVRRAASA